MDPYPPEQSDQAFAHQRSIAGSRAAPSENTVLFPADARWCSQSSNTPIVMAVPACALGVCVSEPEKSVGRKPAEMRANSHCPSPMRRTVRTTSQMKARTRTSASTKPRRPSSATHLSLSISSQPKDEPAAIPTWLLEPGPVPRSVSGESTNPIAWLSKRASGFSDRDASLNRCAKEVRTELKRMEAATPETTIRDSKGARGRRLGLPQPTAVHTTYATTTAATPRTTPLAPDSATIKNVAAVRTVASAALLPVRAENFSSVNASASGTKVRSPPAPRRCRRAAPLRS